MAENRASKLLRLSDVITLTGMKRSWVLSETKDGNFPKPLRLGGRSIAWREQEIVDWIDARPIAD
jgi:prophage regulatory protein